MSIDINTLKIGDIVRLPTEKPPRVHESSVGWVSDMHEDLGKTGVVTHIYLEHDAVRVKVSDQRGYLWLSGWLDPDFVAEPSGPVSGLLWRSANSPKPAEFFVSTSTVTLLGTQRDSWARPIAMGIMRSLVGESRPDSLEYQDLCRYAALWAQDMGL